MIAPWFQSRTQCPRCIAIQKVFRTICLNGCVLAGFSLAFPTLASGANKPRSYTSAESDSTVESRTSQVFESADATFTETRIFSNYSLLIWKAVESVDEGSVRTFSVQGPGGYIFYVGDSGAYWGYHSDNEKLHIFSLNDSAISVHVREILKTDYEYKALLIQDGRIRSYECKLDLSPWVGSKSFSINGNEYNLNTKDINLKTIVEVAKYLSKNGIDTVRDHCVKNAIYLGEAAMRFNEDEVVQPDRP